MSHHCPICGRKDRIDGIFDANRPRHGYGVCAPADQKPVTAAEVREIVREELARYRDGLRRGLTP